MANAVGFQGADFTFAAPKGSEDRVHDLHVAKFDDHTVSCWRLTPEELEQVQKTGVVWLQIMGHGMYPVYVSGVPLHTVGGEEPTAEPFIPLKTKENKS